MFVPVKLVKNSKNQLFAAGIITPVQMEPWTEMLQKLLNNQYEKYSLNRLKRDGQNYIMPIFLPEEMGKTIVPVNNIFTLVTIKPLSIGFLQQDSNIEYFLVIESDQITHERKQLGLKPLDLWATLGFYQKPVEGKKDQTTLIN